MVATVLTSTENGEFIWNCINRLYTFCRSISELTVPRTPWQYWNWFHDRIYRKNGENTII